MDDLNSKNIKRLLEKYPLIAGAIIVDGTEAGSHIEKWIITIADGVTEVPNKYFSQINVDGEIEYPYIWKIKLPPSVTKIGEFAFEDLAFLEECDLKNITHLDDYAFAGAALSVLTFPLHLEHMGNYVFQKAAFKKVVVRGVESIPKGTFERSSIQELTVEDGVKRIGEFAFFQATIHGKIKLPPTLRQLGENAFNGSELEELTLPEGLEIVKTAALDFRNVGILTIPASLTRYEGKPFYTNSAKKIIVYLSEKGENLAGIIAADIDAGTDCSKINIEVIVPIGDLTPQAEDAIKHAQTIYPKIKVTYPPQTAARTHK